MLYTPVCYGQPRLSAICILLRSHLRLRESWTVIMPALEQRSSIRTGGDLSALTPMTPGTKQRNATGRLKRPGGAQENPQSASKVGVIPLWQAYSFQRSCTVSVAETGPCDGECTRENTYARGEQGRHRNHRIHEDLASSEGTYQGHFQPDSSRHKHTRTPNSQISHSAPPPARPGSRRLQHHHYSASK
jgi:hypothetical protein